MKAYRLDRPDILDPLSLMPPLKHDYREDRSAPFDYCQSEVAKWVANIPSVRKQLFEFASQNKLIIFDKEAKIWKGRDWTSENQTPV